MKKINFIKHLKSIKEMHDAEDNITKALQLLGEKDFPIYFSLTKPITFMMEILKDAMNDKYDYISYFVYELDWGKHKMARNCITEKNGKKISLQTESQLYNYIIKQ